MGDFAVPFLRLALLVLLVLQYSNRFTLELYISVTLICFWPTFSSLLTTPTWCSDRLGASVLHIFVYTSEFGADDLGGGLREESFADRGGYDGFGRGL